MFIRSFAVVLAIAALWWSTSSFGLGIGLGELKIDSSLAAPLEARIPLRGLAGIDLDPGQFSITIDSGANTNIEYRLERIDADNANLILYTRESISEPLFEFRVEVKWERSAVARSYDVFMDPPTYASRLPTQTPGASDVEVPAEPVTVAAGDATAAAGSEAIAAEDEDGSTAGPSSMPPVAVDAETGAAPGVNLPRETILPQGGPVRLSADLEPDAISGEPRREYGPTIDGNSIWRVARAVATDADELSIYQWMHAIWKANPGAFYQDNMHRLNMGELLVIPFEREVAGSSHAQAYRAYSEQLAEFENALQPVRTAAVDETPANADGPAQTTDDTVAQAGIAAHADAAEESAGAAKGAAVIEESVSPATSTARATAASVDESAASEADTTSATLSEEESLRAVMALIEEIEASEASIIINPAPDEDALAETQTPAIADALKDAGSGIAADAAPAPANALADPPGNRGAVVEASSAGLAVDPGVSPNPAPTVVAATSEWSNTLSGRRELIAGLPLVGSGAPLSFIGRGIQRTDAFIATSPSWAALAFGAWLTAMIVMLSREIQSRRRRTDARNLRGDSSQTLVQTSPAPVMAPVTPAFDKLPLEQPKPRAPLKLPPRDAASKPAPSKSIDFNADEILTKADSFLQAKNSSEAIKLLELAIKLQPERIAFVVRLLEIFHQLKRADDFEFLLQRFRPALAALDRDEQIHLQTLYAGLCPKATPLIDPDGLDEEQCQQGSGSTLAEAEEQARQSAAVDLVTGAADAGPGADDGEYIDTQVIVMNDGVPREEGMAGSAGMVGAVLDLEDTLGEVDVYLAYGLYDNAEELLLKGMELDPNRVDYLAKLLDTYYATGNLVDFITCAEALHEMGEEALNEYWDKVEIMGYELAPYNKLFAGGKGRSLDGIELQIDKPRSADFDPGASDGPAGQPAGDMDPSEATADTGLREDDDLDLDFKLDNAEARVTAEAGESPGDLAAATAEEPVAEILAQDEDDDLANLGFDGERTANVNFSQDEPRLMDQLEKEGVDEDDELELSQFKFDGDDPVQDTLLQPDAAGSENPAVAAAGQLLDDIEDSLQAADDEDDEAMKFTMSETDHTDFDLAGADDGPAAELAFAASEKPAAAQPIESRILRFPDSGGARATSAEFEAEVKSTLQAMRDQLQYMTERLFRQERETVELRQALNQLSEQAGSGNRKNSKKSS